MKKYFLILTLYIRDWYLDLPGYRNQQNIYQVPVQ
jgi:hypothetical protein